MSFYFLTFLLLAAGALMTELLSDRFRMQYEEKIYWICWGVMTVCLCLRFGQGTDYATYHGIYETIPAVVDLSKGYICGFYPEIGWRVLSAIFKVFHAPFWVFTMTLGLGEMLLLHRYLQKYIRQKTMGLFLLYPVLFITYMVSGLRQGLAICVFLGILVPSYMKKQWVRYVLGVLLTASLHRVGYAWLVLPVVYYLPASVMAGLVGISTAAGLILQIGAIERFLCGLIPSYHLSEFLLKGTVSYFALGERITSFLVLSILYLWYRREQGSVEKETDLLFKACICGTCFYMLLCGSSYYASRYCAIFKILEGAVLLSMVRREKWIPRLAAAFFFGLTCVMGYKNLNAMIQEALWYDGSVVKVWNFPYVSVFDQDKILEYFSYQDKVTEVYHYNIEDQMLWMLEEE